MTAPDRRALVERAERLLKLGFHVTDLDAADVIRDLLAALTASVSTAQVQALAEQNAALLAALEECSFREANARSLDGATAIQQAEAQTGPTGPATGPDHQPADVIEACARYLERHYAGETLCAEYVEALRTQAWGPILPDGR